MLILYSMYIIFGKWEQAKWSRIQRKTTPLNFIVSCLSFSSIISLYLFLNLLIFFFFCTFALTRETKSFIFYRGQRFLGNVQITIINVSNYYWTRNQKRLNNRIAPLFSLRWRKPYLWFLLTGDFCELIN